MSLIRIDKFLADMQQGTRSEVKQMIKKGLVKVDGTIIHKADEKLDPEQATVFVCGERVGYSRFEYFMLNKPQGCVYATEDARHKTVLDYITTNKRKDLFPVGRLDIDTEGLLLITNDGALAHDLLSPSKHIDKTYYADINGMVDESDVKKFFEGIDIGEKKQTRPAILTILKSNTISQVTITIREGKYHQIKRMFAAIGKPLLTLKRISMGPLILDDALAPGEYRELTEEEIILLKARN
ncbi:MAG: pseudouridine synthase [bacterium]|nr:pseudouridine synthase [bacterium]